MLVVIVKLCLHYQIILGALKDWKSSYIWAQLLAYTQIFKYDASWYYDVTDMCVLAGNGGESKVLVPKLNIDLDLSKMVKST